MNMPGRPFIARVAAPLALGAVMAWGALARAQEKADPPPGAPAGTPAWLGDKLPLPLTVKTPQDLELKAAAERQYLIFNLLATGKLAWDEGDYATASQKWQALLAVPGLDPQVERAVKPLLDRAREIATDSTPSAETRLGTPGTAPAPTPAPPSEPAPARRSAVVPQVSVAGRVTLNGGGVPQAAVWLKRTSGRTPAPTPGRPRIIRQANKTFAPVVSVIPMGTTVGFTNEDPVFHNVFSLSAPNDFDSDLIKAGGTFRKTFTKPGAVLVQCNLHASPPAFILVVDSPWFDQSSPTGHFNIRGVPPGSYTIEAWHAGSNEIISQRITVGPEGLRNLDVKAAASRRAASVSPKPPAPAPL